MGAVLVHARADFGVDRAGRRDAYAFWPLALLVWAALNTVFLSADLFNLYVALELMTLAAVGLVALRNTGDTVAAALRYLFFAFIGALLYLLGVALLYAEYATLDVALLALRAQGTPATLAAAGLMTAGLAAKGALFPLHGWLPPAHAGAPTPASALLSALVPKAAFFIALRLWFDALPAVAPVALATSLGILGLLAILHGSVMALRQARLKLVIAYSTVAQVGYLFLVFPLAGAGEGQPWAAGAFTGGVFHALSHAAAKAAMFLSAGLVIGQLGHDRVGELSGLARLMPATVLAFALSAVTLMGLPPSGGFIAKYMMLTAAFAGDRPLWAVAPVIGGLLAAAYLFRPLAVMLRRPADGTTALPVKAREALPLALAALAIVLGIASAEPYRVIQVGRSPASAQGLE
jgi:formate hydrogenlyase subunit 3/multisubunit Na+/H+ antiporter MnhD subunit